MADRDKLWGPGDRATLTARSNLASAYLLAGRVNDALLLQERNLADAERLLGPDHGSALTARGNLASTYQEAGRLSDAMPLLKRSAANSCRRPGTLEYLREPGEEPGWRERGASGRDRSR